MASASAALTLTRKTRTAPTNAHRSEDRCHEALSLYLEAGILVGLRELTVHAPPSTWAGAAHRRKDAGEVALVRESAAECNLSQRKAWIAQQLLRQLDAALEQPTVWRR